MSSLTIRLRPGIDKSQKIYIHFNYGRKKQFRYSTGLRIFPIGVNPVIQLKM